MLPRLPLPTNRSARPWDAVPPCRQVAVANRCVSEIVLNLACIGSLGLVHLESCIVIGDGEEHEVRKEAKLLSAAERIEDTRKAQTTNHVSDVMSAVHGCIRRSQTLHSNYMYNHHI